MRPFISSFRLGHAHGRSKYRPDIDGMRAIAVLVVVLYHAFPTLVPGGFVGVDVFFVISGFLISNIVYGEIANGTFRLQSFYSRRILRIFPALLLVLLSVFLFGWLTLFPHEFSRLGKHMAAAASFVANLAYWREAGYFDVSAETKPLLHLWSLGVEEQFYFFWPLFVWFLVSNKFRFRWWVNALTIGSFALCIVHSESHPTAAFYSPLARLWELMLGGWLATSASAQVGGLRVRLCPFQSCIGLGLLGAGIFLTGKHQTFPGWIVLFPTIGTIFLISAGPSAIINRYVLSNRVLVGVGLISYPLYLWHWPLLTFLRILGYRAPEHRSFVLAVSFVFALMTYRWVERPFRRGGNRRAKLGAMIVGMFGIALLGYWTMRTGFSSRQSYSANRFGNDFSEDVPLCNPEFAKSHGLDLCSIPLAAKSHVAFFGDSHAWRLFLSLAEIDKEHAYSFVGHTGGGGVLKSISADDYLTAPNVSTVIFTFAQENSDLDVASKLSAVLKSGKPVILVIDNPRLPVPPQDCDPRRFGPSRLTVNCATERILQLRNQEPIRAAYLALQKAYPRQIQILDTLDFFCGQQTCSYAKDHVYLYGDEHHLSALGAEIVSTRLLPLINTALLKQDQGL